jgi:two-component sensor histidine kinase
MQNILGSASGGIKGMTVKQNDGERRVGPFGAGEQTFPARAAPRHAKILADPRRLASLAATGLTEQPGTPALQRVTRLATRLLGTPVSLFSVVDAQRQVFAAACGTEAVTETPLSHSFCQYVVAEGQPLEVEDARNHPLLRDNGAVSDLGVIAYLGHPVHAPDGAVIGSFCVIDSKPRAWTADDRAVLADLAAMVENELRLRAEVARGELLARELDHRVRNLFAIATGMVRLSLRETAGSGADGAAARALAERLSARLSALAEAHRMALPREQGQTLTGVELADLIGAILRPYQPAGTPDVGPGGPPLRVRASAVTYLALGFHELATNAVKYGGLAEGGQGVTVGWRLGPDGGLEIDWCETGVAEAAGFDGFGSTLLRNAFQFGLGGRIRRDLTGDKLCVLVSLPPDTLEDSPADKIAAAS